MAKLEILSPFILSWEKTTYTNNKTDKGGPTKMGITLATWKAYGYDKNNDHKIDAKDVMLINKDDYDKVLKEHYWDVCKGDELASQNIANLLVDWYYNSGNWAIKHLQKLLNLEQDGIVGQDILTAINNMDEKNLFISLWHERESYYKSLSGFKANGAGWLRRLNSIQFDVLIKDGGEKITW